MNLGGKEYSDGLLVCPPQMLGSRRKMNRRRQTNFSDGMCLVRQLEVAAVAEDVDI